MSTTSNPSVIVYGPQGCGKSSNAGQLGQHFGVFSLIDDWEEGEAVPPSDHLILTQATWAPVIPGGAVLVLSFDEAMRRAGFAPEPAGRLRPDIHHDLITQMRAIDLHESPFNVRQHFNADELESLAANLVQEGILQPLLVRPRIVELFKDDPNGAAGYEVVCGHRRLRAAILANIEFVPVIVRSMTDTQARTAQVSENLQRENVHALEEAEALHALMETEGLNIEDLIQRFGKSRSYIYGRLKLLSLNSRSREAFLAGDLQI